MANFIFKTTNENQQHVHFKVFFSSKSKKKKNCHCFFTSHKYFIYKSCHSLNLFMPKVEWLHGPNGVKPCYASISTLSILHEEPTLDTHSLKMHNFEICQKNMSKTLMIFFSHSCVTGKNCSISQRYAQGAISFSLIRFLS